MAIPDWMLSIRDYLLKLVMIFAGAFFGIFAAVTLIAEQTRYFNVRGIMKDGNWLKGLSTQEAESLMSMLDRGEIISPSMLLDGLSSFYTNVFQIQIVLLTIFGFLAYFYIRSMSREAAENMAKEAVKVEMKSPETDKLIAKTVENEFGLQPGIILESLETSATQIADLSEKLQVIEDRISLYISDEDDDDMPDSDLEILEDNGDIESGDE